MKILDIPLWPDAVPFASGQFANDIPTMDAYLPEPAQATGYGMLALPGGGYSFLSERSGREYGEWFAERGIAVFVVKFRLGSRGFDFRAKCADAYAALAQVRAKADQWGLDPAKIGVIGTSAGAHLAGVMCSGAGRQYLQQAGVDQFADISQVPAFGIFCYGVLTLTNPLAHIETRANFLGTLVDDNAAQLAFSPIDAVHQQCPRSFIWHTAEDTEVSVEHSWLLAQAMRAARVPCEFHLYQKGAHALGLARNEGLFWADDCLRWITR